jgi:hypothetical protein
MKSKYFHISFFGSEILDSETFVNRKEMIYSNIGILLNSIYPDEIFDAFGAIIVTEKLYCLVNYESDLTGFEFELPVRYEKGFNFLDNYPDAVIPPFRYMKFTGVSLKDDFSFYQRLEGAYNWVVSEKAVKFLLENGMTHAHGEEIVGLIQDYCDNYETRMKAVKYLEVMPRLFLKDFI